MRFLLVFLLFTLNGVAQNDTTYHYYVNGDVSVEILPWDHGKRTVNLYDLKGSMTYTTEEVKLSYSVRNTFKFYKNGAVMEMVEHTNPGASRYFYETKISFTSTNRPLFKKSKRTPEDFEHIQKQSTYYWDQKIKLWKKQEVVSCDPPRD